MPANVSVSARASVTAGFANDVDAVNQYAAAMYAATAKGTASSPAPRTSPDHRHQAERRDELTDQLRRPAARVDGQHEQPFSKHHVRGPYAKDRSEHLRKHVGRNVLPAEARPVTRRRWTRPD